MRALLIRILINAFWNRVTLSVASWAERRAIRKRLLENEQLLREAKTDEEKRAVVLRVHEHISK